MMKHLKSMRLTMLLLSASLAVMPAWANDWKLVGKNAEYELYIEPSTIKTVQRNKISPKYQQAWFKFYIHTDISKDGLRVGDYKLRYFQFDCAQQTLGLVSGIDYFQDGTIAKNEHPPAVDMKPVVPDSVGQGLADTICLDRYAY